MRMSRQRQSRTQADDFASTPYLNITEFLKDIAALTKCHEDQMQRSVGKGVTVLGSLMTATEPAELGYIMNVGRFIARNREIPVLHGTTHNEAYHLELKAFFRNVMSQSARHARMIARIATVAKLVASAMQRADLTRQHRQVVLLKMFLKEFADRGYDFDAVVVQPVVYPQVRGGLAAAP